MPGDGYLLVPREDVPSSEKANLSQIQGQESRPFFVEGLVCLDSKYCAVKEQMCVSLNLQVKGGWDWKFPSPEQFL